MDQTDLNIIRLLMENGRMSHEEIARSLNFSRPTIHHRVQVLMNEGIIDSYTVNVNWNKLGFVIDAFILLFVHTQDYNKMLTAILALSDEDCLVLNCYRVTGKNCVMLRMRAKTTQDITKLHDKLLRLDGLIETNTMLVLQEETRLPELNTRREGERSPRAKA